MNDCLNSSPLLTRTFSTSLTFSDSFNENTNMTQHTQQLTNTRKEVVANELKMIHWHFIEKLESVESSSSLDLKKHSTWSTNFLHPLQPSSSFRMLDGHERTIDSNNTATNLTSTTTTTIACGGGSQLCHELACTFFSTLCLPVCRAAPLIEGFCFPRSTLVTILVGRATTTSQLSSLSSSFSF